MTNRACTTRTHYSAEVILYLLAFGIFGTFHRVIVLCLTHLFSESVRIKSVHKESNPLIIFKITPSVELCVVPH